MSETSARTIPDKFLVAFSFAGEQRQLVRSVAEAVEKRLGTGTVYFDDWYEHYLAGSDADTRLQDIYGRRAEMVVVCVSGNYGGKPWTLAEHEAIRALNMQLRTSPNANEVLRILPLRVGDGDVKGIPFNAICPDIRSRPIEQTADLIVNRLRIMKKDAGRAAGPDAAAKPLIYLAETTPDLEDSTKPVNRERLKAFLENLGWMVLPEEYYPDGEYQALLEADMARSLAFVQLRGPYPWKRGGLDQLQNDAAMKRGVKRFLYRSPEIVLSAVEPAIHRAFLSSPDVIYSGFDDFLVYLERELQVLLQAKTSARVRDEPTDPPLVRVVTHSTNPDALWEQVFQWIYLQERILTDHLAANESFESKHQVEPCQGFLVVCDGSALEDGPMSPRRNMEQCRLIQIREKEPARRPPVALVYWPPPDPNWARLLRSIPLKLYYAAADLVARQSPPALGEFFAEVRRVAR